MSFMKNLVKTVKEHKSEIMFTIFAILVIYWLSILSAKRQENKHIEYMEDDKPVLTNNAENDTLGEVDFESTGPTLGSECAGNKATFVSSDLLPKTNPNDKFNEFTPDLKGMNMLDTTDFIGVDTVSNTLRNANYSIRSEPPNPRDPVSPWMNSTIAPDLTRLKLDM